MSIGFVPQKWAKDAKEDTIGNRQDAKSAKNDNSGEVIFGGLINVLAEPCQDAPQTYALAALRFYGIPVKMINEMAFGDPGGVMNLVPPREVRKPRNGLKLALQTPRSGILPVARPHRIEG